MTHFLYVFLAMMIGIGSAVQIGFIGQLGRLRGVEALIGSTA